MPTMYVNKPGGIIAHLDDGTAAALKYGEKVPDNLAEYVDASGWSDSTKRLADGDAEAVLEAQRRAALADGGQPNSSSSPVPGNYSELDEEGAVQYVMSLAAFPDRQAGVIKHEILFGGRRQRVLDAASEYAQTVARMQIEGLGVPQRGDVSGQPAVSIPSPTGVDEAAMKAKIDTAVDEALSRLGRRTPAPSGQTSEDTLTGNPDVDDLDYEGLKSLIDSENLDVPKNIGKDAMRQQVADALEARSANT